MKNRINQIFELNNNQKYLVYKQVYYKGDNYYLSIYLKNGELTNIYEIFEEKYTNNIQFLKVLEDKKIKQLILKNLGLTKD